MNIKSMLAEAIINGAAEGIIPFETAKDEFVRRYEKGSPKAMRRAEKNLVRLTTACDHQVDVPNVEDHLEAWKPTDLDILLDLRKRAGTWAAAYLLSDMKPARIAAARGLSANSISTAMSVERRKNREADTLTAADAAAMLTL